MPVTPRTLHLQRTDRPITLEEFRAALADIPGVRLNRRTPVETDAEIYVAVDKAWVPGLTLLDGQVVMPDQTAFHLPGHAVRDALEQLARVLGARVVDGSGVRVAWSP
jgi:hypothetical protein